MKSREIHAQRPAGPLAGSETISFRRRSGTNTGSGITCAPGRTSFADRLPVGFEGYQPYTDEKIVNWKEANDDAGRIGGWREYAKEASESQTPDGAASGQSLEQTP